MYVDARRLRPRRAARRRRADGVRHRVHGDKLGKSAAAWARRRSPRTCRKRSADLKHATYKEGDDAVVTLRNPLASSSPLRALLVWGNRLGRQSRVTTIAAGAAELRIPLGVECRGGCERSSSPPRRRNPRSRRAHLAALCSPPRPSSPNSRWRSTCLPSDELDVSLALGAPVAPPGGAASFTVLLRDAAGAPSPAVRSSSPSTIPSSL